MRRIYVFGDEAGDLTFKAPGDGISRYFMIGTVTTTDCAVGEHLLALRRDLAFDTGVQLTEFHATSDKQHVRDQVFEVLAEADFRIDVTILAKAKAYSYIKADPIRFYKTAWWLHFKFVAPKIAQTDDELLVVASSLSIERKRKLVGKAVGDVVTQVAPTVKCHTLFAPAATDPCLQMADYSTWAIQRRHERGDLRSYDLIKDKIKSEFKPWGG